MMRVMIRLTLRLVFAISSVLLMTAAPVHAAAPATTTAVTTTSSSASVPSRPSRPTTLPATIDLNVSALPQGEAAALAITVDVPAGYHAQSNTPSQPTFIPFKVTLQKNDWAEFGAPIYPKGESKVYPMLGPLNVYEGRVLVHVPVRVHPNASPGPHTLVAKLQYQICDDQVCLAPRRPTITLEANVVPAGTKVEPNKAELFASYTPPATQSAAAAGTNVAPSATTTASTTPTTNAATAAIVPSTGPTVTSDSEATQNAAAGDGGSGGPSSGAPAARGADKAKPWTMWTWFGAAVLAGLAFNIMPCVLPVLPLKAAAFHRAAEHHRGRSMLLGFAFSLGIIGVFGILAVLVLGLRVIQWGELFSKWWFVWPLVGLLVACALGMFGVFSLELPTALYAVDPRQDTFGGNVVFGAFTAILATPCTAPLLPGLLVWGATQPVYVGVPAMLLVGVGMAIPYLILSATPELAKKFPRSGPWPELFKQMMGFMLLAVAVYFAGGRLIHGPEFWWLVTGVIAIASLYLVARTVQLSPNGRPVGISSTLAVIMLGGALWWTTKITGVLTPPVAIAASADGKGGGVTSFAHYSDAEFNALRAAGKPVLVKFTANWCATCQYIEGTVFRDAAVWQSLARHDVTPLKVDLTAEGAPGEDLLKKLNPAGGIPLTAIFIPGREEPIVIASIYNSAELLAALEQIPNGKVVATAR
jgi:thiol:disulfide interchange protein